MLHSYVLSMPFSFLQSPCRILSNFSVPTIVMKDTIVMEHTIVGDEDVHVDER